MRFDERERGGILLGISGGTLYGLLARAAFQWAPPEWLRMVTLGFLCLVPVGVGALTVALSPVQRRRSWTYAVFAPWAPCFVVAAIVVIFALDLWVCVAMALPIFMAMSSLGGALVTALMRRQEGPSITDTPLVGALLLLPFALTPLTNQVGLAAETPTVHTQIAVLADAETVWQQIIAVPPIQPEEQRLAWFVALGLPRPLEAQLTRAGEGGMRLASYANGMRVLEPVRIWEPYRRYGFDVQLDPATPLPSPIWGAVESEYFDVEQVLFELEPTPTGVLLHLTTTYRLSTQMNRYAGLWMDFLLRDFETYILDIVKARAESSAPS
jgi:hypothetical protein